VNPKGGRQAESFQPAISKNKKARTCGPRLKICTALLSDKQPNKFQS